MQTKTTKTAAKQVNKLKSIRVQLETQRKAERLLAVANKKNTDRLVHYHERRLLFDAGANADNESPKIAPAVEGEIVQDEASMSQEDTLLAREPVEIIQMDHSRTVERHTVENVMEDSYLRYSMSVIIERALPDVRDGLKPVHRRILYSMGEQGLRSGSRHKKSAKVVGEVMGNYHPHGDSSIYDALVRLAQPWSMRYMLINGQGNFGSVDGDSPAARAALHRVGHDRSAACHRHRRVHGGAALAERRSRWQADPLRRSEIDGSMAHRGLLDA